MPGLSVGIDVGGTFTDLAAVGDDGAIATAKVLSDPSDQSNGVMAALRALGAPPADVARLVHGTTVVTNLLLERTGARVAFCATDGHTDVLHLRRQDRARLYDLSAHHPPALVPAELTVGVAERVEPSGVRLPLDDAEADRVADRVASLAPDAVAVALLHAYRESAHERRLARALEQRLPDVDVVLSSSVLPEIREFERAATTAAEAYARPRVARYLGRLAERLHAEGYPAPAVMTSSGGVRTANEATQAAASLALSGPAGGVTGAAAVLRALGTDSYPLALTIDIGGTSADVGLVVDGEPLVEAGGSVAGVPIALPRVLVETVSAGGGSIGWVDDAGALRAGPRSAGAVPGPAAFGRGGTDATVTDAHIVLGHIAGGFQGGVRIDDGAATRAVQALAERLQATGVAADASRVARAVLAAADAAMARALRRVSVERGVDPRACVLVAFGGGGPLHACALAEQVGVRRVLVPPHAGVLSAVGLALAPPRREAIASVMRLADSLGADELAALRDTLGVRAGGVQGDVPRTWVRARYAGQGHELEIPVLDGDDGDAVARRFGEWHLARVGFTLSHAVELVSARQTRSAPGRAVRFARGGRTGAVPRDALVDDGLALEATVRGPATIVLPDATLRVPGGWTARALDVGGWLVEAS